MIKILIVFGSAIVSTIVWERVINPWLDRRNARKVPWLDKRILRNK